jgi:hypothetical protein
VLGGGLLERARSTTLALLGVTAAVGLGTVALALNQSWPLIAGSPVPAPPAGGVAGGEAGVADAGAPRELRGADGRDGADPVGARARGGGAPASATPTPARSPAGSDQFVAASKPVASKHSASGKDGDRSPSPPAQPQQPAATGSPQPAPAPTVSAPASPPSDTVEEPPPAATPSSAPDEESFVPAWSRGNGHAYGRGGDRDDGGGSRHGGGHGSHGRDWRE